MIMNKHSIRIIGLYFLMNASIVIARTSLNLDHEIFTIFESYINIWIFFMHTSNKYSVIIF